MQIYFSSSFFLFFFIHKLQFVVVVLAFEGSAVLRSEFFSLILFCLAVSSNSLWHTHDLVFKTFLSNSIFLLFFIFFVFSFWLSSISPLFLKKCLHVFWLSNFVTFTVYGFTIIVVGEGSARNFHSRFASFSRHLWIINRATICLCVC